MIPLWFLILMSAVGIGLYAELASIAKTIKKWSIEVSEQPSQPEQSSKGGYWQK